MRSIISARLVTPLILLCSTLAAPSLSAFGAIITVPSGLAAGAHYRLAFVTSTTRDAQSTNIADYNTFVTNAANAVPQLAALSTTWSAIGSTAAVDARDNTLTNPGVGADASVPIYTLNNTRIDPTNAALWGGTLEAALNIDQSGNVRTNVNVWTGSKLDGTGFSGAQLGSTPNVENGFNGNTNSGWMLVGNNPSTTLQSLYAISGVLTVPEPGSLVLAGVGVVGLALPLLFRRRCGKH